ncbi:MAG: YitT family protein [Deltaproteobacteria bacterium]|nr:YitT family protein [Deltaproteobacteria bacterium]
MASKIKGGISKCLRGLSALLPQMLWNLSLIALGSALCAMAVNGILVPRQFLSGGFTGVALIIHYLLPDLPLSGIYFVLNIPNYAVGWRFVGSRFFLYSVAGMFIFSAAIQFIHVPLPVYDQLLSAILAGIIVGIGSGIILKSLGSAGGTDILSVIFLKIFSIRLGSTILAFNSIILVVSALLFSLEKALYTLIYLYITSFMVNLVVTGLSQRKAVYIISPKWKEISQRIMEEIQRGVTIIRGQGGFSGREQQILYTVITFRELSRLKQMVKKEDPEAFVVVTETLEVMGQRVGNQPHW